MNIKSNQYISHMISGSLTIICLLLCHSWYFGVWKPQEVDYGNLFILALFFYMTGQSLCSWFLNRTEKAPSLREVTSKDKIFNIEFLRVVFTIGILTSHFFYKIDLCNRGWLGVMFFFMLSGFFLNYRFSSSIEILEVIKKRISQFLPLIICGSFLHILFIKKINIADMFAEFLLITSTGMYTHARYNCVSWYISVLFWVSIFYLYLLKYKKKDTVNITLGIIAFLGIIGLIKRGSSWQNTLGSQGDIGYIFDMRLIYGLTCIAIGYFIAEIYKQLLNKEIQVMTKLNIMFWTIVEIIVCGYSFAIMFVDSIYPKNFALIAFLYSFLILLFLMKKGKISQICEHAIWLDFSKYALSTYLVQSISVLSIFDWFHKKNPDFVQEYKALTIILTLMVCFIFGVWAHYVIEKPCGKFLRKVLK